MLEERVLCWNCRGAGSKEFACKLNEIIREHKPMVVILLEPRVSGEVADVICKSLGKNRWIRSEALGFLSEVWVLWNEEDLILELEYTGREFFTFVGEVK